MRSDSTDNGATVVNKRETRCPSSKASKVCAPDYEQRPVGPPTNQKRTRLHGSNTSLTRNARPRSDRPALHVVSGDKLRLPLLSKGL